jgi:hypothetical protein
MLSTWRTHLIILELAISMIQSAAVRAPSGAEGLTGRPLVKPRRPAKVKAKARFTVALSVEHTVFGKVYEGYNIIFQHPVALKI